MSNRNIVVEMMHLRLFREDNMGEVESFYIHEIGGLCTSFLV